MRTHTIENAETHRFGGAAHLFGDIFGVAPVDQRRRGSVNVDVAVEHVDQFLIHAHGRAQPQFELAIVGTDQLLPRPGYKCRADPPAQIGTHRNVLQVRVNTR